MEAKNIGKDYKLPTRQSIGGKYLDALYETYWKAQMDSLLIDVDVFGVTIFGDGATIKGNPLLNVLAAGVHNPFALLDIVDCTEHHANGGKKDAHYLAHDVIGPLIERMERHVAKSVGHVVDLAFFDGASNVQNAGAILQSIYPRITVGHGAEHVVSLLFLDCYLKV